jgi:hypothetical protein
VADPGDYHRGLTNALQMDKAPSHQAVDLMTIMPHIDATGILVHTPVTHGHIITVVAHGKQKITKEMALEPSKRITASVSSRSMKASRAMLPSSAMPVTWAIRAVICTRSACGKIRSSNLATTSCTPLTFLRNPSPSGNHGRHPCCLWHAVRP